ncbi:helix-turn-helix domain-containing protein [Bradyrhizobium roseum]|uniref:hypothetical protein n=1 Tax=Bradyrhizobium roseum TaxID=3056648 RepID=UPI002634934D|nr:hypothetical protein [Bradyrhizobium roseus]WKA31581.1 hypothetical protein QUH67_16100 [Bradyrhizobium roseus]
MIDALGGLTAVAALTGAAYKLVSGWRNAKRFPARYYLVMTWALKRERFSAPPSLWGQVTTAEMEKAAA